MRKYRLVSEFFEVPDSVSDEEILKLMRKAVRIHWPDKILVGGMPKFELERIKRADTQTAKG